MDKRKISTLIVSSALVLFIVYVFINSTKNNKYLDEFKTGKYKTKNALDTIQVNFKY